MPSISPADHGTRTRILRATFEVLSRKGHGKLSLSDVAAQAKVSRPTLYRFFGSKAELLAAFGAYETGNIEAALRLVTDGLEGSARLDAVLRYMVEHQGSYSLSRLVDIEPDYVLVQLERVIPIMRRLIEPLVTQGDPRIVAGTLVRLAVAHYLVGGDDRAEFLAQLRQAAGIAGP
ncbi:helix-turn-helix domain-containing protein [Nocardia sp. NPDC050697]|uniref:TetR/AcrR family transcriptional regulator n=1 Tax=Nocardia sp. NPDC050697 TaxID=3155158 RepID=UPI0033EE4F9C